jgi:hypothetical protein
MYYLELIKARIKPIKKIRKHMGNSDMRLIVRITIINILIAIQGAL